MQLTHSCDDALLACQYTVTMTPIILPDQSGHYRIQVQGRLEDRWRAYFDGLSIEAGTQPDGTPFTTLTGEMPDQAAVIGVLHKLYSLGLLLLSVQFVGAKD
jgi:hypothetical protein